MNFDLNIVSRVRAAALGSLPMGTVVQITPATVGMCSDINCTGITSTTLPYKLVKMNTANSGDAYFMLADNYCWWGSANCSHLSAKRAYATSWNGASSSDYINILSTPKHIMLPLNSQISTILFQLI